MTHTNEVLNDLASATRDGKSFYEMASFEVADPELKALFTRIAKVKGDIAEGLATEIFASGERPVYDRSFDEEIARNYVEVRALLGDKDYTYVAQLENSEDKLLQAFDSAISDSRTSEHARGVISRFLPEVRSCHKIMSAKKAALREAA